MVSLLKRAQKEASLFVILGDLFDIWVGEGSAFQREYAPLIEEFQKLRKTCRILYFEGNHDFHLEKFWKTKLGFEVYKNSHVIEFDSVKIWAEHGDEINRKDYGYLALRWFWRTLPVKKLIETIPSEIALKVGQRASRTSRKYTQRISNNSLQLFRAYALKLRQQKDFDLLLTGHSHIPDDFAFEVDGRKGRLINLGSWFDGPHYLKVNKTRVEHIKL